jgi:hypothetical protein
MHLSMADDYDVGCWIFLAEGGFEEGEEGLTFLLISSRALNWIGNGGRGRRREEGLEWKLTYRVD